MPLQRTTDSDIAKINWVYAIMGWGSGGGGAPSEPAGPLLNEDGSALLNEDGTPLENEGL